MISPARTSREMLLHATSGPKRFVTEEIRRQGWLSVMSASAFQASLGNY